MSRCLTLEEYLQEFVDENTQPAGTEEVTLLVTNRQAQTLGFFLINGLAGFVERMRLDSRSEDNDQITTTHDDIQQDEKSEEFIN
jgi:hypothetical protein